MFTKVNMIKGKKGMNVIEKVAIITNAEKF